MIATALPNPDDSIRCVRCGGHDHYAARVYCMNGPLMRRCMQCGFSVRASEYVEQSHTAQVRAMNAAEEWRGRRLKGEGFERDRQSTGGRVYFYRVPAAGGSPS